MYCSLFPVAERRELSQIANKRPSTFWQAGIASAHHSWLLVYDSHHSTGLWCMMHMHVYFTYNNWYRWATKNGWGEGVECGGYISPSSWLCMVSSWLKNLYSSLWSNSTCTRSTVCKRQQKTVINRQTAGQWKRSCQNKVQVSALLCCYAVLYTR